VAPSQFEIAPVFESANVAADHQQLIMTTLKRVAERHGMVCLLHEKPFAGVNGSGKHVNFSFGNATQGNMLDPGDTPHDNVQFLVSCAAVIRAVDKWQGLLRASVAHAGNDHRLGANEAPPAIISIFLGDMLTDIFDQIEKSGGAKSTKQGGLQDLGVSVLPKLPRDAGDRNRTSPFAFTGNKFEFRAVGSTQNIAWPNTILNVAMADSLEGVANELEAAKAKGEDLNKAVGKLLVKVTKEHKRIIFNGNNYAPEWEKEAGKRKLLNHKNTVDALAELVKPEAVKLLDRFKILNEREAHARYEVFLENYNKTINIEGQLAVLIANRYILPAAFEYQKRIGDSVAAVKQAGGASVQGKKLLAQYTKLVDQFKVQTDALAAALDHHSNGSAEKHAKYMRDKIVPVMAKLREVGDQIEVLTPHEIWPLPTYREMLFVK
jgi:glutamine synthetase